MLTGPREVRLLSSPRDGEVEALFVLKITLKGRAPRFLRKTFWGCKIGKRLGEDLHLQGMEKVLAIFLT